MFFEVGRTPFNKAVGLVSNALPSKDYGDASSGILLSIEKGHENKLFITANSVECFIQTSIALKEKGEAGHVVPNGKILSSIVGSLKNLKSSIYMELDDKKDIFTVECGEDYEGSIAHYDVAGFYMPATIAEIQKLPNFSIQAKYIKKAIDEVSFACSKDKTAPELTGVLFEQHKDGMNIVGCDSMRLSVIKMASKVKEPQKIVVPVGQLQLLKKVLGELEIDDGAVLKFFIDNEDKKMAYFIQGDTIFGFQTYGKSYFDEYKSFVIGEEQCAVVLKINRQELIERLDLATSHNSTIQDPIKFLFDGKNTGTLESRVSSSESNVNYFSIPFKVKSATTKKGQKDSKIDVAINPQFFYDFLSKLKDDEVKIALLDKAEGPVAMFPVSDGTAGDLLYVSSLV